MTAIDEMRTFILEGAFTADQPLTTCSKDLKDREGVDNKPMPVPHAMTARGERLMFPATGIRGAFRRAGRDVLRDVEIASTGNPTPFNLDEHYMLTLGGNKGGGAQVRSTVAHEADWRGKNPLLSLFGAGDAGDLGFVAGRLSVGNAVCESAARPVVFSGARTDDFYRDKSQVRYLSDDDLESLVRRAEGGKSRSEINAELKLKEKELRKAKKSGTPEEVAEVTAAVDLLTTSLAGVKESTGTSDVSLGLTLAGFQAIPQDETLNHRMILVRSNLVELGFLLRTLERFAFSPFLGAHFATGCGMVSAEWEVFEARIGEVRKSLGVVTVTPFAPLVLSTGELVSATAAFDEYIVAGDWNFRLPKVL